VKKVHLPAISNYDDVDAEKGTPQLSIRLRM